MTKIQGRTSRVSLGKVPFRMDLGRRRAGRRGACCPSRAARLVGWTDQGQVPVVFCEGRRVLLAGSCLYAFSFAAFSHGEFVTAKRAAGMLDWCRRHHTRNGAAMAMATAAGRNGAACPILSFFSCLLSCLLPVDFSLTSRSVPSWPRSHQCYM